jgi:hypothetical protein
MLTNSSVGVFLTTVSLVMCLSPGQESIEAADIAFDLPSSIECRDVTPPDFAVANPHLKQIEAKVRISAREIVGDSTEILQFDYEIRVGQANRVIDFSPKTLLESTVVEDEIDVTDAAEDSSANKADATIVYNPLLVGGSHNTTAKKSESKHFKQLAPKDVVLASGTVERGHGVFFRIRPSRSATFEGAREFVLVLAVPKAWRAEACQISCTAKLTRHHMMGNSVALIGGDRTAVGMYLLGDAEAWTAAEQLRETQDLCDQLGGKVAKANLLHAISTGADSVFARGASQRKRAKIEQAMKALHAAEAHLEHLSASPAADKVSGVED